MSNTNFVTNIAGDSLMGNLRSREESCEEIEKDRSDCLLSDKEPVLINSILGTTFYYPVPQLNGVVAHQTQFV